MLDSHLRVNRYVYITLYIIIKVQIVLRLLAQGTFFFDNQLHNYLIFYRTWDILLSNSFYE